MLWCEREKNLASWTKLLPLHYQSLGVKAASTHKTAFTLSAQIYRLCMRIRERREKADEKGCFEGKSVIVFKQSQNLGIGIKY